MLRAFVTQAHTKLHRNIALNRRVQVLSREIAALLPDNCTVLDVGCGSGEIAQAIVAQRENLSLRGIDVLVRPDCAVEISHYDGITLPEPDNSYDFVTIIDVLHHTADPMVLMREACRVARRGVIIKDHNCNSKIRRAIMTVTDTLGNWQFGVPLLFNFWPTARWQNAWSELGVTRQYYSTEIGLYPPIRGCIFAKDMDFIAMLSPSSSEEV